MEKKMVPLSSSQAETPCICYMEWGSVNIIGFLSFCRYASESVSLACKFAYRNATPGTTLEGTFSN